MIDDHTECERGTNQQKDNAFIDTEQQLTGLSKQEASQLAGLQTADLQREETLEKRRALQARWTITAVLSLTSASQIGTVDADNCDQSFVCDEQGHLLLHGSTLAGALRDALMDQHYGYRNKKPTPATDTAAKWDEIDDLFGDVSRHESQIIVFDARSETPATPAIRDGQRLDPQTRQTVKGHKYDREVCANTGLQFPIRFDVLILNAADSEMLTAVEETFLLRTLCQALNNFQQQARHPATACLSRLASLRLGSRKTRGLGECQISEFRACRYDLQTREGWQKYAASTYTNLLADGHSSVMPHPNLPSAVRAAFPDALLSVWDSDFAQALSQGDHRRRLELALTLDVDGTLLIRSPGHQASDADVIHLTEAGKRLLSGTALAGSLRHQCLRILNTLQLANASQLLEDLFGTLPDARRVHTGVQPIVQFASRLSLTEASICDSRTYRQTRTQIDRFVGGTIDGALFDEQPSVGGYMHIEIGVIRPRRADIALVLMSLRDLLQGLVTVGGDAAVGRGLLKGSVDVTLPDKKTFSFNSERMENTQVPDDYLQQCVDCLVTGSEDEA